MLTQQEKKNIYSLLVTNFDKGIDIPLASISLYLTGKDIDYKSKGYNKLKSLLADLDFITLKSKDQGYKDNYVIINDYNGDAVKKGDKKEEVLELLKDRFSKDTVYELSLISNELLKNGINPNSYGYSGMKAFIQSLSEDISIFPKDEGSNVMMFEINSVSEDKKREETPALIDEIIIDEVCTPIKLLNLTKKISMLPLNMKQLKDLLIDDYQKSIRDKTYTLIDDMVKFPISLEDKSGEQLIASIKRADEKCAYSFYYSYIGSDKKKEAIIDQDDDHGIFVPPTLLERMRKCAKIPSNLTDDDIKKQIEDDYQEAIDDGLINEVQDAINFPSSFTSNKGEVQIIGIKPTNTCKGNDFYVNYFGTGQVKKSKEILKENIYFEDFDQSIQDLSTRAKKENWCYRDSKDKLFILKIYFENTFNMILKQDKLKIDKNNTIASFNTGLKDKNFEDIYAVLKVNKDSDIKQRFIFVNFTTVGTYPSGKEIVEYFNPLPESVTYIKKSDDMFFDTASKLITDTRHILLDNIERLPSWLLDEIFMPFKEEREIYYTIKKTPIPLQRRLYIKLSTLIESNDRLYSNLEMYLDRAIERSKRMVKANYRYALPSYSVSQDQISLMLPLVFDNEKGVEDVLLVQKKDSGNYQGETILTLKQCYVNARLIGELENTFLDIDQIKNNPQADYRY